MIFLYTFIVIAEYYIFYKDIFLVNISITL